MTRIAGSALMLSALLAGCSSSGLTTGSVSGAGAPAAPAGPVNDVTSRAMQVGSVSARAQKCGYNFDPGKLKASFIASESKLNPADVAKANQVYDIAHNGVLKAVAAKADYCSDAKTAEIKQDLTRHLAGDFSPRPPKVEKPEPGLFDSWGDGNASEKSFGGEDWWAKQQDKAGN
jgi:hypothetical protein